MRSIACFFVIIILMCPAYAKPGSDQRYPATTVDLNITADTKAATANQTLNISFVISNIREYDATNIEIYPDLSDIIEWPRKKLEIGNKVNTSKDGYGHQLSSNFDKDIQIDDHAYIYKDGKIEIQIGHLRKGDSVVINYTTSLVDDAVCDTKKICLPIDFNNGFRWTKETDKRDPKIHEITKIKDTISTDLKIIVQPLCNITESNATSCTILEGTKLGFVASDIETDLNDLAIEDNIIESRIPEKIYNNSEINKLGGFLNTSCFPSDT